MEMENGVEIPQEIKNRTTICCCCCCSIAKSCPTLCNPIDCSMPVTHHLPEFAWVRVYWLGDALSPSRTTALLWWRSLGNSMRLCAMLCHSTAALLPRKSHGRRGLVGCSPWGREESDTTERLHFHFSLSRIGEGNGNPLQCSWLENPRDGGAWWAAVYGVAQRWTRLKGLSNPRQTGHSEGSWQNVIHWRR